MRTTAYITTILVAALLAAPGWAQRAGQGHGVTLPGKVIQVDGHAKQMRLALYMLAPSADAPGNMPDEMVAQVAQLKDAAEKLEQAGKTEPAREIRDHIEKLMCWRQVDQLVAAGDTKLFGIRRANVAQIAKGTRIRMIVSSNTANATEVPDHVVLERDVVQVGTHAVAGGHRIGGHAAGSGGRPETHSKTFFEVVGEVTSASPLTVQAGDKTIHVSAAPEHSFIQQSAITPSEVTPGQHFIARVHLAGPLQVQSVARVIILLDNVEVPPLQDDDLET